MAAITTSGDQQQAAPTVLSEAKKEPEECAQQYKCENEDNPQVVQWYVDLGQRYGQWFLSLKGDEWVFQPSQSQSSYKYLLYMYDSKEPLEPHPGIPFTMQQSDDLLYSSTVKTCIETTSTTQLNNTDLPQSMIGNTWIPVNPRFFKAFLPQARPFTDQWVLESLDLPGYCLAYDASSITASSNFTPAILVKEGDPNWDQRFIYPIDSGRLDGTPHYIFRPIGVSSQGEKS
ncbi:uncharacterized protein [Amphiura filiformis]|uniref:uncharacterized protein n=1 Tax=Amphiura filiformis TaxID=82378 RepID=UPI003B215FFB